MLLHAFHVYNLSQKLGKEAVQAFTRAHSAFVRICVLRSRGEHQVLWLYDRINAQQDKSLPPASDSALPQNASVPWSLANAALRPHTRAMLLFQTSTTTSQRSAKAPVPTPRQVRCTIRFLQGTPV